MDDPSAYVRLATLLRGQIESGELEPGKPAPSITTLVQEHGVPCQTARALRMLERGACRPLPRGLGYSAPSGSDHGPPVYNDTLEDLCGAGRRLKFVAWVVPGTGWARTGCTTVPGARRRLMAGSERR
jgi:hypothetical protein